MSSLSGGLPSDSLAMSSTMLAVGHCRVTSRSSSCSCNHDHQPRCLSCPASPGTRARVGGSMDGPQSPMLQGAHIGVTGRRVTVVCPVLRTMPKAVATVSYSCLQGIFHDPRLLQWSAVSAPPRRLRGLIPA